jgi:nitric-oxide synthase, bacterial
VEHASISQLRRRAVGPREHGSVCPITAQGGAPSAMPEPLRRTGAAELLAQAETYLQLFESERGLCGSRSGRLAEIRVDIRRTGTYRHTPDELAHGARMAWRNSARCIGRLHWETLEVRDLRHLDTAEAIFEAMVKHMRLSTNGGKISIFAPQAPGQPGIRIWNSQLIRYAAYRRLDGSVLGDPLNVELTEVLRSLGWPGGEGTPFDILPLAIQVPGQPPRLFELPRDAALEVPISHPDYPWFAELGLRWHALPAIADMRLEIGGVSYTAAPFSGWYMVTEIGARDLGDVGRYNLLPVLAERMGLDTRTDRTLWRDRAIVELNVAVLHSFAAHGVSMVDHHTAARQFVRHEEKEQQAGRRTPAQWSWIVPPISGSATPVFFRGCKNFPATPNYRPQAPAWREAPHSEDAPMAQCPYAGARAA